MRGADLARRSSLHAMSTTLTSQLADLGDAARAFVDRAPLGNFIAGEFTSASETFTTLDPSTGAPITEIAAPRSVMAMSGARKVRQTEMPEARMTVSSRRACRSSSPMIAPSSSVTGRVFSVHSEADATIATIPG